MTKRLPRRSRAFSVNARVRLLIASFLVVTVAIYWLALRGGNVASTTFQVRWWILIPAFCAAELCMVHIHFRRESHSFSMSEAPLVLGLLFAAPGPLLVAQMLGVALALGGYRRLAGLKVLFNVAQAAMSTAVAAVLFQAMLPSFHSLNVSVWPAAFAAATASAVVSALIVSSLIAFLDRLTMERFRALVCVAMVCALTNASLALIAATLLIEQSPTAWLLVLPTAVVFVAYRAYVSEREKHESLEFLYHSARTLAEAPEIDEAVRTLLSQAREMFRAEAADVWFITPDGAQLLRTTDSEDIQLMQPVVDEQVRALWRQLSEEPAALLLSRGSNACAHQAFLETHGMRDAMVTALRGEDRAFGLMCVSNRAGSGTFDPAELRLFETLANHASVALENGRLEQSLAQLRKLERRLQHLAYHDPLTSLPNRALFSQRVEAAIGDLGNAAGGCAVLFIDLDDFKTVNDTLGHDAGDQLLCAVAQRLLGCLRPYDTAARLGGDEFAVLLEGIDNPSEAERVADRIIRALRPPVVCGTHEVPVRASIGIAPSAGFTCAADLLRNADLAMYTAKSDGKGSFKQFQPSMGADIARRHHLKADLARAVDRGEFRVQYQPIVDLRSGRAVALEALARWRHPQLGVLPPAAFIPMAEETGLITSIGATVLHEACAQTARWQEMFPTSTPLAIAVNLSPVQLRRPEVVAEVAEAMTRWGLAPRSLILEITESSLVNDPYTIATLAQLRQLGARIALDDFGTGYSSLGQLSRLPVDILKIAQTFVDDLERDSDSSTAFATAIIALGNTLRLTTLAEGVEQPWQAARLRRLGCGLAQGFHFARPLDADDVAAFLAGQDGIERDAGAHIIAFPA